MTFGRSLSGRSLVGRSLFGRFLGRGRPDEELDEAWAAFGRGSDALEVGMRALLATVPSARYPGAPLATGVQGFVAGANAAQQEIDAWRLPELAGHAAAAHEALDRAAEMATALPQSAAGLDFEHRNERIDDVLAELDPLRDAEQALRALRRRGRRHGGPPAAASQPPDPGPDGRIPDG